MHRFLIHDAQPDAQGVLDLSPIARQLQRVLRATPGQEVLVLDGSGRAYATRLQELGARYAWGLVFEEFTLPEPALHLTLFQCALKADKFEWILQKGTELGIGCFVPVLSARTVVRPLTALEKKRTRWETILREAAEQCGRVKAPLLAPVMEWSQAVHSSIPPPPAANVAPVAQATRAETPCLKLLPWEERAPGGSRAVHQVPSLGKAVAQWQAAHSNIRQATPSSPNPLTGVHIACCIGPEGGLEASEVETAQAAGWQVVGLGPRILRAETAALAATAIIMQLCGELDP